MKLETTTPMPPRCPRNGVHLSPRILILGWYGYANAGDEAILHCLKSDIGQRIPAAQIIAMSSNPKQTEKWHNMTARRSAEVYPGLNIWRRVINETRYKSLLAGIDVTCFGGGSLFTDAHSPSGFAALIDRVHRARRVSRVVAVIAAGIGPILHEANRKLLKDALTITDLITVRDTASKKLLEAIGVTKAVNVVSDPAWGLPNPDTKPPNPVQASSSIDLETQPYALFVPRADCLTSRKIELFRVILEYLRDKHNLRAVLLPMQLGGESPDLVALQVFGSCIDTTAAIRAYDSTGLAQIKWVFAKATFVLAERFHACLFALSARKVALFSCYESKTTSLLQDLNLCHWALDENIPSADVIPLIERQLRLCGRDLSRSAHLINKMTDESSRAAELLTRVLSDPAHQSSS